MIFPDRLETLGWRARDFRYSALPNNAPDRSMLQGVIDEFGSCSTTVNATTSVRAANRCLALDELTYFAADTARKTESARSPNWAMNPTTPNCPNVIIHPPSVRAMSL